MNKTALVIAASDPSGGAGIEADIKTLTAHRVFARTVISALTVQDTRGVREVHAVDLELFKKLLEIHLSDLPLDAVKIGALPSADHVRAVSDLLRALSPSVPAVLDPVLRASSGMDFLAPEAAALLKELLFPLCAAITPNLPEASFFLGRSIQSVEQMREAARELNSQGPSVLLTGGHLEGEAVDVLCHEGRLREWRSARLEGEFHGTGCVLASALAAGLARGLPLEKAAERARAYVRACMKSARPGRASAKILDFPPGEEY